jgi:Recombinase
MTQPIYIIYGRFSGEGQRGNSSEERQLDFAHYKQRATELGLPFREVPYFDDAKSGFYGDNLEAELGKIFRDIKSGATPPGSTIGVESHSRLGRLSANEALYQYLDLLRLGIRLDIRGKALRTWDSIGGLSGVLVLMEDFIDMVIAHKHSADLQRTLRDTNEIKRQHVRRGEHDRKPMKKGGPGWFVGHRCPAWLLPCDPYEIDGTIYHYRCDAKEYTIGKSLADIIRMIFGWADYGIGTYVIARRLTEMGVPPLTNAHRTKKPKIAGWSHGMVGALLRNIAVIGLWQPKKVTREREQDGKKEKLHYALRIKEGEAVPYYPPIIDPALFRRVGQGMQRRRKDEPVASGGRRGRGFGNIITKLCDCACCSGRVTLAQSSNHGNGKMQRYLRCENARRKIRLADGSTCPNRRGMPYLDFETGLQRLLMPSVLASLRELIAHHDRDDLLERRIAEIEAKLAEAERAIERLVRRAGATDDDDLAMRYERDAKATRVERDKLNLERDRLIGQRVYQGESIENRIAETIGKAFSPDTPEQEREDKRAKLNALLASYARFFLTEDRSIRVEIAPHNLRTTAVAYIYQDGSARFDTLDIDGSVLTTYDRAGLALLEPFAA